MRSVLELQGSMCAGLMWSVLELQGLMCDVLIRSVLSGRRLTMTRRS